MVCLLYEIFFSTRVLSRLMDVLDVLKRQERQK